MGSAMCTLFRQKPVKVLYFGLDAAGKTTLLYRLKLGEIVTTIPTIGFNIEDLDHNGVRMTTFDIGTRDKSRPLYRHYLNNVDGMVFVVDCSDHERLEEAVDEFFAWVVPGLNDQQQPPVLVLANKQDVAGAITSEEVRKAITSKGKLTNDFEVFPTTALTLDGVTPAMDWLTLKLAINLARDSSLPSVMSSASLSKVMHYPSYFLKNSYLTVAGLFAGDNTDSKPDSELPIVSGEKA